MTLTQRYALCGGQDTDPLDLLTLALGGAAGARALAAALLERFDDPLGLSRAELHELAGVPGMDEPAARRLHAALHLGLRALRQPEAVPEAVTCAEEAWALLSPRFRGVSGEELHALYLDRRRRPLALRTLTRGSDQFTVVDPRQIFRPAVALSACAVLLAHNHPSGDPTPSPQDVEVTRRVHAAGAVLGVQLLDHLVLGDGAYTSIASRGDLPARPGVPSDWIS